ncbi:hypothetical protein ACFQY0_06115 [Haloferula chungangensis]|uniref:HEAT repeat domain-containing protein n=1 Tax=Haloferula chungangensis TaxID=1048331 RepID=A0ABW2L4S4_9BACT
MDLRSLPPSDARDFGIAGVIGDLAEVDPQHARLLLDEWDDALIEKWLNAAKDVVRALAPSSPHAAASFIEESVPRTAQVEIWAQFLNELPPNDRIAYFDRIPEGEKKLTIVGDLLHVWLAEDPIACAHWLDAFAVGRRAEVLEIPSWSIRSPSKPSAKTSQRLLAVNTATNPVVRRLLAKQLWEKADKTEQAALLTELETVLPEIAERDRERLISQAPAEFAASLSTAEIASLPAIEARTLIDSWANKHPEAALEWGVENHRPEAAQALRSLYGQEAEKALELAATLTPGRDLDDALSSLCSMAAFDGRVEEARKLIPLIQNPDLRTATINNVEKHATKPSR